MSYRLIRIGAALWFFAVAAQVKTCSGADVHGTIQLHSKSDFAITTSGVEVNYDLETSNTNDFSLKAALTSGSDSVVAIATDGTQSTFSLNYRLAGPGTVLQGIKQAIHVQLQSPEDITWYPEAVGRSGYTTYGYHGHFSPEVMSFNPPVVFNLYDGDTIVGTTGKLPIRELRFKGKPLISLHAPSVQLNAQRVSLEIEKGFTREDNFLVETDTTPLKTPELGTKTEITFIGTSDSSTGVPFEMYYYPTGGLHVIAFPEGFKCNDLRIDGTHVLGNSVNINTTIFRIPMKWYRPFEPSYDPTTIVFDVTFGDSSTYIYGLRMASGTRFLNLQEDRLNKLATDDETKNALTHLTSDRIKQLAFSLNEFSDQPAWYALTTQEFIELTPRSDARDTLLQTLSSRHQSVGTIELPIVSAAQPFAVTAQFVPPNGTPLGTYDGDLMVSGSNLEKVHIPVRYELYDPIGPAKQTFGGVFIALLTSYLGWALFDRRRKINEATKAAAVARFEYIREHYADLLDLKQRMAQKLQLSNVQWSDVSGNIGWLMERKLQSVLTPAGWSRFQRALVGRDAGEICKLFNQELEDLEPKANAASTGPEAGT